MHTGYDNYWMYSRQQTDPSLLGNVSLSDRLSLNSYPQIQGGRQTSHLNDFIPTQKNINQNMTSQNMLSYSQKTPQYGWTSMAPRSSIPYNYQTTGVHLQQKNSTVHWPNLEPRLLEGRNNVSPSLNYNNTCQKTPLLENPYIKPTTQAPRIRVRDVNSLNNIVQNSVPIGGTLERYLNSGYNINQTQQNPAQKNNVEPTKYIPSLLDVNPFQSLPQKAPPASKQSVHQDWFANMYPKPREQVLQSDQGHLSKVRRNEPSNASTQSWLQELLGLMNQLDTMQPPEAPRNVHSMNAPPSLNVQSRLSVPPVTTKNGNLNPPSLPECDYNLGQSSYRNLPPHSEGSQRTTVPPVSQGNSLPIIEPISPPLFENNTNGESSIRVTAVISLPEWCGGRVLNRITVPSDGNFNCLLGTESTKEKGNPETSNNDLPSLVPNDAPNSCLKVKEEPTFASEFTQDNTTEIVIQNMKTEDFGEQDEGVPQNSEQQMSDKDTPTSESSVPTAKTTINDGNNYCEKSNNNNNEDRNEALDKSKIDPADQTPTEKFTARVETTADPSDDSSNTNETKPEVTEPNYKSKINRDKLDMLIEFINGSDKYADYVSEQKYSEKSKKHRKVESSTGAKSTKSPSEKSKNSVRDTLTKVARVEITRCSTEYLPTTKSNDSGKKPQIKTKNDEPNTVLKNHSKEVGNADKAKPKIDTKRLNPTDGGVLWRSKEAKDNRPKNKDPKKIELEKKPKTGHKSVSSEDQTQVTVTTKNPELTERSKNVESNKPKADASVIKPEKSSEPENCLVNQSVGKSPTCDFNQTEKPKVYPTTEAVKKESKGYSNLAPSVREEEQSPKQKDHAQKDAEKKGKKKTTRIFPNLKYQFCESCAMTSPTECFWMNVISGEVKCSNCLKKKSLDSVEASHELFTDEKNPETKMKDGCREKIHPPDGKNPSCNSSENQSGQRHANTILSDTSDDKKCQRRHSTGNEDSHREKRRSVDEDSLHEKKEKRRKSEEKSSRKTQEQIPETLSNKSKIHGFLECSKTNKSVKKSLSKDGSQSPRKEERPRKSSTDQSRKPKDEDSSSKGLRKMESSWEGGKKRVSPTEDLWPRKIQVVEKASEDCKEKYIRKLMAVLEASKQSEKEKTKSLVDREKNHAEYNKTKKSKFSFSTDPLKENQCTKVRSPSCEKPNEPRKERDEKKKSEKEMAMSTKEHGERKKRTINGPLQYKDFVLKKSPVLYFPDPKKDVPLTKILEEVDATKRNRKCNEER